MVECGTNIVDCLKTKGIEPHASASSERGKSYASNALNYTKDNMFHSDVNAELWWKVDFKRAVTIYKYQIETYKYCSHIKKWNITASNDNRNWRVVDIQPEDGFPCGRNYTMNRVSSARYIRVNKLKDSECLSDMAIIYVKFFGSIYGALPDNHCTHVRKNTNSRCILTLILINCK